MATITKRQRSNGTMAYLANVRIRRNGTIIHQESKTFDRMALAKAWGAKRELELQALDAYGQQKAMPIKTLISGYLAQFIEGYGRSKKADVKRLLHYELAEIDAYQLTAKDLIAHCIERNKEAKPQTVQNDIIWLRTVMRTMRDVDGHDYPVDVFDTATIALRREKADC
jgi:hypothetical protein